MCHCADQRCDIVDAPSISLFSSKGGDVKDDVKKAHGSSTRRDEEVYNPKAVERVEDEVDVCIVGAGPAGLSAAIRIKQLERERGKEVRVVVLEKGGEVGAHILSGAVLEPRALYELLGDPSTYEEAYGSPAPLGQPATSSKMKFLTNSAAIPLPHPPQMNNKGNHIISLSALTRWLAQVAEEHYGVEIYPGFSGSGLIYSEDADAQDPWTGWAGRWGKDVTRINPTPATPSSDKVHSVQGIYTNDLGVSKSGHMKPSFEAGMGFRARVTLLAEGAHGSLSKLALAKYNLRAESEPQTYGFGMKEVWRIAPEDGSSSDGRYRAGEVVHTLGFPMDTQTYGGGWVYHMENGLVSLGLVVGADWKNPYRSPYRDFQKMKHHPYLRKLLTASDSFTPSRIAYGARVLSEGGLQSVPLLHFPGGALIGCSAGFVNITKIKGIHNAMKTGMLGAEGAFEALHPADGSEADPSKPADLSSYSEAFTKSWVHEDLKEVRNVRPSFATKLGMWGGVAWSGLDSLILRGKTPFTFRHTKEESRTRYINASPSLDSAHTEPASKHKPIDYPAFEPPLSTDLMTSVSLTGTNHAEDQVAHLRVMDSNEYLQEWYGDAEPASEDVALERKHKHTSRNVDEFAGLLGRACPAGVYEYVDDPASKEAVDGKKLVINAQNCIHCKLCDVKVPTQDITWTVPEGGGGPKYIRVVQARAGCTDMSSDASRTT
ncbi:FAD/NAD(P)-binding domain-containing protein [Cylindrobasidium torrendii FP15055 ss-10]|uniref:Probable electron transfer flavoprotein-ubiquinone oxidoreductase, mitochondrial n=1 Tax=Cylindrobasidium torrendii FP15055 ss-10 TaxID=1314674 RepID=A0A0D7BI64_9AGAR|nr:FAD/NAD(P)-binding domain-containing protein [Cylindrobasidium torrendii FP15055 ss-10]